MAAKAFYIKGFDGLRAVSIIMVLCTHFGVYDNWSHSGWVNSLTRTITGSVGVTIFFVISGFLITTLLLNEKQLTGTVNYKNFIIRRFLRLLPTLLIFYATILLLINFGILDIKPIAVLLSACYVYNFVPNPFYFSELGHTWSLAVEEQFYVFWPWVIYGFRKKGLLITAMVLFVLSLIAIYVVPGMRIVYQNEYHFIGEAFHADRFFFPAIAPIMIGCALATINFYNPIQIKTVVSKVPVIIFSCLLILSAFFLPEAVYQYLFVFQAVGFALLLTYIFHHQQSALANFLEWKPLAFIGKVSYGIYVWQGLFLGTGPGGHLWIQQPVQNIILTVIIAVLSYYFIEKKVLKLKARFQN